MVVAELTDNEKAKEVSLKIEKAIKDFRAKFNCQRCGKCCQEGVGVALWPHEFTRLRKLIPELFPGQTIYKHIKII